MIDALALSDATWPAVATHRSGPFLVREGRGGGQRVSSAVAVADWTEADIDAANGLQASLGQPPLFLIGAGDGRLDSALAARGYRIRDPVVVRSCAVERMLGDRPSPLSAFCHWPPLAIARDIWVSGGVGPERIAVMERAPDPKCAILGRQNDRASGTAFVAVAHGAAMLHALHVVPDQRRQGSAVNIMRHAALWAQNHGVPELFVLVTQANEPANRLYASLGMEIVGKYHYRSA